MTDSFKSKNAKQWDAGLTQVFPLSVPATKKWTYPAEIVSVLNYFCGKAVNHTMLPSRGGSDILRVAYNSTSDLIEFSADSKRAYVSRPATLEFAYIKSSPVDSFFLLTIKSMDALGLDKDVTGNREEVIELPDGRLVSSHCLDRGYIGHDEDGNELPVPENYRLLVRFLEGKYLMVAKSSRWNRANGTYDGRHNKLTAADIHEMLSKSLEVQASRTEPTKSENGVSCPIFDL
jgi:hypothetical protein